MGTRRMLAGAAAVVLALGACGGDDDGASADDTTTAPEAALDGTCAGTNLAFTNLTTGATVEVTDTAAVSFEEGAAYTAYLADFDIDPSEVGAISSPTVADDSNMVTVFITVFNADEVPPPIEAGTEIVHTGDFGVLTFGVVHAAGAEEFGNNTDGEGTATVTAVGDSLCVEVDYADAEKTLSGTFEAEVTAV